MAEEYVLIDALRRLIRDRKAATAVEYGLIAGLVVIAMIAGLQGLAGGTIDIWTEVSNEVDDVVPKS